MRHRSLIELVGLAVAVTFMLVGLVGFLPGLTTNLGDIAFAGHESEAELLGVFQVSVLHNVVHMLFGVAGLVLAMSPRGARNYLVGGGIVYLALFAVGAAVEMDSNANFVPVNAADNTLHLALGAAMLALGFTLARVRGLAPRAA